MERKNSAAKIAANSRYTKKAYDDIKVRVHKGKREVITEYAARKGLSLNGYITALIAADMGEEFNTDTTAGPGA